MMTRLFFCTDLHGSENCFRQFLHAGDAYEASVVLMGGDCTGKMIIPLVGNGDGAYEVEWAGQRLELRTDEELAEQEKKIKNNGLYPVRLTQSEMATISADPEKRSKLF